MDQIQVKRARLLRQTARIYAGSGLIASFALLSTPPVGGTLSYWLALPVYAVAAVCVWRLPHQRTGGWVLGVVGTATAIVLALTFVLPVFSSARGFAVVALLAVAVPGSLIAIFADRRGPLWFGLGSALAIALVALAIIPTSRVLAVLVTVFGAVVALGGALALTAAVPPALRQVAEIGRAHRAERHASELEAQRRQNARLLHDTVLATLTLLAHSGRGVSEQALREQARNDAHLLRLLRLGEPLFTLPEAGYRPEPVEETTLGTTLDSVKRRFEQLGLDVTWHGSGRILLPPAVLDGLLSAISECLENVRRHSGVELAHVTITEDERAVRAMITDAGVGFEPDAVGRERLGLKESVVSRLTEVGGSARLFSSPGAGTTVLLEVPR